MDDRKLKEYALKIFQGVNGYSLNKAFSLFPKYYPKIAFYYSQLVVDNTNKFTSRIISVVGINKAISIKKQYEDINSKALLFYVDSRIKFKEAYTKMENAQNIYDKYNSYVEGLTTGINIMNNSIDILADSTELLFKTMEEAKKYKFGNLEQEINKLILVNKQANEELTKLNKQFSNYLKEYQYKEL